MTPPEPDTAVHRALADPRRVRIVEELRSARGGLDASELGERVGLHTNTVRFHLGVLSDAGVVSSRAAERQTPGRPRILYTLSERAAHDGGEEYRLLATILAGTVSSVADGVPRAEEAGRAWGRYLVTRPLPLVRVDDDRAVGQIVDLLAQQGFEPEQAENEIRMRRCPFHDLAETYPEIVCSVHRGLISGALAELGSDVELDELDVFPQPDVCIARLRSSGGRASASR
jgi:predicted ArsR family transcriptional regulator